MDQRKRHETCLQALAAGARGLDTAVTKCQGVLEAKTQLKPSEFVEVSLWRCRGAPHVSVVCAGRGCDWVLLCLLRHTCADGERGAREHGRSS